MYIIIYDFGTSSLKTRSGYTKMPKTAYFHSIFGVLGQKYRFAILLK